MREKIKNMSTEELLRLKKFLEARGAKEQAEPQEFIWYMVRDPAAFLEERFSTAWIDQTNGIQGIYGYLREHPNSLQPMALLFMKANGWTIEKMQEWLRDHPQYVRQVQPQPAPAAIGIQPAQPGPSQTQGVMKMSRNPIWERVWTRNYINNLPDAAFAIILPGGEKDETGKTVPRILRKFPHHNAQGRIDLPHLRNASARVPQSDLTAEQKAEAQRHLDRHKKAAGIGEVAEEAKVPFKHGWPVLKEQAEEPEEVEEVEFEFVGQDVPEWADSLISAIEDAIGEINDNFDALVMRVEALEKGPSEEIIEAIRKKLKETSAGGKRKGLGEAIIRPSEPLPSDLISKQEVLKLLPEDWIVRAWSYGPQLLVRQLRHRLESRSSGNMTGSRQG